MEKDGRRLDLSRTQLTSLEGVQLPGSLQELYLYDTPLTSLEGIQLPGNLQRLDLCFTQLTSLEGVQLPGNLQVLYLYNTNLTSLPESIRKLKALKTLDLCDLKLKELPDWLPELGLPFTRSPLGDGIILSGTTVEGVDMSIFDQSQETIREWFRNRSLINQHLQKLRSAKQGKFVRSLRLFFRPISYPLIPLDVFTDSSCSMYDLDSYYYLNKLSISAQRKRIHVRWVCGRYTPSRCFDNTEWDPKTYLPAWRSQKPLYFADRYYDYYHNINLLNMPGEIFRKFSQKEPEAEEPAKPLNELKVVFLGDGEAGKSHTIARLLNNGIQVDKFRGVSTPGIVIEDKEYQIGSRQVKVHYWDFGGQEILHSMHRMFLTERTLYVVMLNVREGNQDDRARYWLHNLKSFANGAPVLLVLNKMDMNKNASVNESDLRKLYPKLTEIVKLSTKEDSEAEFNRKFRDVLLGQIGKMDILDYSFIPAWSRLKNKLQNMTENYIKGGVFRDYCDDCGVRGSDAVRRDLLNWFSDLGVSFCYSDKDKPEDYVVLRPDWITNAIYIILFNKIEAVTNGLVTHDTIYRMLSSGDTENVQRTVVSATYTREEVDYVLNVIRKFRLSFPVENESTEFMPMLCNANSTAAAEEYENDPDALEFRMHYDYLPNNVIHRLMVDHRKELDQSNVWLTGARFVCGDTGRSAVVKSEGNLLRIFVRAEGEIRNPQRYLDELKTTLERINTEMGLTVGKMEVAYKEAGRVAYFNYGELLFAQDIGETQILCMELRKKVLLSDVLMQSDYPEDENQKRLLTDIRQACARLQDRKIYWAAKEDDRTDFLMDQLEAAKYTVQGQKRVGISAGGIQSGELDLDIRLNPGDCWSALEALNLTGSSDNQIEYWNAHLKKLLSNYNHVGRSFLFHVSYVLCKQERFDKVCAEMYEHLRFYSPPGFEVQRRFVHHMAGPEDQTGGFIRVVKAVYDCGGIPMTVYHFFVRMGE